jgi:hypothetical protein
MGIRVVLAALLLAFVAAADLPGDIKKVEAEPNLEKRSKLALENATEAYQAARDAYEKGDMPAVKADIDEIGRSVDLAYDSLQQTGKNPRKSPKWFKNAEMATRELARRLDSFQQDMSYEDRPLLDKVKAHVLEVHDKLLMGLMEGKKK